MCLFHPVQSMAQIGVPALMLQLLLWVVQAPNVGVAFVVDLVSSGAALGGFVVGFARWSVAMSLVPTEQLVVDGLPPPLVLVVGELFAPP